MIEAQLTMIEAPALVTTPRNKNPSQGNFLIEAAFLAWPAAHARL